MTGFELDPKLAADTTLVARWPLCEVLLMDDAQYPWLILVPRRMGVTELYQINEEGRQQWLEESTTLSQWLMEEFEGHKLNIGALGNQVSQLHIHYIVRYRSDPAWPGPVWGAKPRRAYTPAGLTSMEQRLQPLAKLI